MTMCGASGAGKTTTGRCLHETYPGPSVFFDLDHEPDMGTVVTSVPELSDALESGTKQIAVRPPATVVEEPELFEATVRYLLELGNQLRERGKGQMQFLMDEAQNLGETWTTVALKRMRKRRIKPVAMTQDPVSLPTRLRTVADFNAWLSPPPSKMVETLKQVGYPVDLLRDLPQYDMLVLGENWEPVGRFRAPEEYARD
jgi:hypothetical protein